MWNESRKWERQRRFLTWLAFSLALFRSSFIAELREIKSSLMFVPKASFTQSPSSSFHCIRVYSVNLRAHFVDFRVSQWRQWKKSPDLWFFFKFWISSFSFSFSNLNYQLSLQKNERTEKFCSSREKNIHQQRKYFSVLRKKNLREKKNNNLRWYLVSSLQFLLEYIPPRNQLVSCVFNLRNVDDDESSKKKV